MKRMLLPLLLLSACGTISDKGSPEWYIRSSEAQIITHYTEMCQVSGFHPGTVQMEQCIGNEIDHMLQILGSGWNLPEEREELKPNDLRP